MGLHMRFSRAATLLVALATGLAFAMGEAQAQYYPSGPYQPGVRLGPPMPVEDADDGPDIYAPPPPPTYSRRPVEAPYPGQAQQPPYEFARPAPSAPGAGSGHQFPGARRLSLGPRARLPGGAGRQRAGHRSL